MRLLSPADLSDSTLSYTETEAASSSNATLGEFSGWSLLDDVVWISQDDRLSNWQQLETFAEQVNVIGKLFIKGTFCEAAFWHMEVSLCATR